MKILGISGSLRRESYNSALLRAAREVAGGAAELEIWDGLKAVPPYDDDDDGNEAPAAVTELRAAIAGADAVLIATPEYNSSVPGQLKNALDWASRPLRTNPLRNKPVAVVGASTGVFGAVWAQAELRKIVAAIGARPLESGLPVSRAPSRFDDDGQLVDGSVRDRLAEILDELAAAVEERAAATLHQEAA